MTVGTFIDYHDRMMTFEGEGKTYQYNPFKAIRHPSHIDNIDTLDVIDKSVQQLPLGNASKDPMLKVLIEEDFFDEANKAFLLRAFVKDAPLYSRVSQSIVVITVAETSSPMLVPKLKQLLEGLKYEFISDGQILPIIISDQFSVQQSDHLLPLLRKHHKVIDYTISDIRGLDLVLCMHHILMEDYMKPSAGHQ